MTDHLCEIPCLLLSVKVQRYVYLEFIFSWFLFTFQLGCIFTFHFRKNDNHMNQSVPLRITIHSHVSALVFTQSF